MDHGSRLTAVMLMASWCLYCAYEDKWVWPTILQTTPGLQLNIVDVSDESGIGVPGSRQPAFTGHDSVGPVVKVAGMELTMRQYIQHFNFHYPNAHVFVAPNGGEYWKLSAFPTILFFNRQGRLVQRINGAPTEAQLRSVVHQLLQHGV